MRVPLLLLLLAAAACQKPQAGDDALPPAPKPSEVNAQITVRQVREETVGRRLAASARVAFDENEVAHVFSPVTGRVTRILAQLGDHVRRGQTLAILASPDMGNAVSDVDKARPAVIQTAKELAREKELYAAQAGPLRDLEAARAAYAQALAEEERAEQKLRLLMKQARASHVSQVFPLVSPIDGEVLARQINPGLDVQGQFSGGATQELYTIGREEKLWVLADVYEQDLSRVKVGAPVEVTTVAYPGRVFPGKIDWIAGELDPVQRTAAVRCTLANPDHLLKAQMYATVTLSTEGHRALAIPREALLHFGDKQMVIGVDPGRDRYVRMPVIADEGAAGDLLPVLHGLEPGDQIVVKGAILLSDVVAE